MVNITVGQALENKDLVELLGNDKQKASFEKNCKLQSKIRDKLLEELGRYGNFNSVKDGRKVIYIITEVFDEVKDKEPHGLTGKIGNKTDKFGTQKYSVNRLMEYKVLYILNNHIDIELAKTTYPYIGDYSSFREYVNEVGIEVHLTTDKDGKSICDGEGFTTKSKIAENYMNIPMKDTNIVDERMYQSFINVLDSLERQKYIKIERKYTACLIGLGKFNVATSDFEYNEKDLKFFEASTGQYLEYSKTWNIIFNELCFKDKYENKSRFLRYASAKDKEIMDKAIRSQLDHLFNVEEYTTNFIYETIKIVVRNPVEVDADLETLEEIIEEQLFVNAFGKYMPLRHRDYYNSGAYRLTTGLMDKEDKKRHVKSNFEKFIYNDIEEDNVIIPIEL